MKKGEFPEQLKVAEITAIHKGKSKSDATNYRPVSLTSVMAKTLEKCVKKRLVEYLEKNNMINTNQHGFRAGRSCLTQLIGHYSEMLDALEQGANYDSVYLDYAKALDKVGHGLLGLKMKNLGICGNVARWLEFRREQCWGRYCS